MVSHDGSTIYTHSPVHFEHCGMTLEQGIQILKPNTDMFVFKWKNCHLFKKNCDLKVLNWMKRFQNLLFYSSLRHMPHERFGTRFNPTNTKLCYYDTDTHVHMHHTHMKISVSWLWIGKWPIFALIQWLQPVT